MSSSRVAVLPLPAARPPEGFWRLAWRRLLSNRLAAVALVVVACFGVVALAAPLLAPHDPSFQDLRNTFAPPGLEHPMGTDQLGRDWLSRLIYGARLSLAVAVFAQVVVVAIGVPLGLVAGYLGRAADSLIMRLTDLVYAFPDLLLIILLRSVLGGSLFTLFLIIGLVGWVDMARLVRGQVLSLRQQEFVEAARSLGAGAGEVMLRHLLPNLMGPLVVVVAFGLPRAVFIEASLSFIGVGADPGTPSWGSMVQEGYGAVFSFPHLVVFPSAAIALLMLAFTFLGDGLRDALDPRYAPARRLPEERYEAQPAAGEWEEELRKAA